MNAKFLGTVLLVGACGPSAVHTQARIANGVAAGANVTLEVIASGYKKEVLNCITLSETRPQAETCIQGVDFKWSPVWAGWKAFRQAHSAWADVLEHGKAPEGPYQAMAMSWCSLKTASQGFVQLPELPIVCGGKP